MHDELSIKEAQKLVDKWIHEYGVRYFSELTNMACLTEELQKSFDKKTKRDKDRHKQNKKLTKAETPEKTEES